MNHLVVSGQRPLKYFALHSAISEDLIFFAVVVDFSGASRLCVQLGTAALAPRSPHDRRIQPPDMHRIRLPALLYMHTVGYGATSTQEACFVRLSLIVRGCMRFESFRNHMEMKSSH